MQSVFDAGFLFLHFRIGGSPNVDLSDTASQLGQTLLQLLFVVVGGARFYFLTDLLRYSEYRGIPIGLPRPDPINVELTADDPGHLVHTLTPLGLAASAAGRGLAFAREVSAIVWDGQVDGWDQGEHLAQAAARADLSLPELQQWVSDNPSVWKQQLADNDAALEEHHWGVPTMVFRGEPFFGQDKIELLLWRMQQQGLQARDN